MKIDKNKSEQENVLNLLNEGKTVKLTFNDIEFKELETIRTGSYTRSDPNKRPLNHNTRIKVAAKSNSRLYKGNAWFNYRRIDIGEQWTILGHDTTIYYQYSTPSESNVKEHIKNVLNPINDSLEITVTISGKVCNARVVPKASSICYIGELNLLWTPKIEKTDIYTIVSNTATTTTADGFDYNDDVVITEAVSGRGVIYSGRPSQE